MLKLHKGSENSPDETPGAEDKLGMPDSAVAFGIRRALIGLHSLAAEELEDLALYGEMDRSGARYGFYWALRSYSLLMAKTFGVDRNSTDWVVVDTLIASSFENFRKWLDDYALKGALPELPEVDEENWHMLEFIDDEDDDDEISEAEIELWGREEFGDDWDALNKARKEAMEKMAVGNDNPQPTPPNGTDD